VARTRWSERIAYHESGHFVTALAQGLAVEDIRLGPIRHGSRGAALTFANPPRWFVEAFANWGPRPLLTADRQRYIEAHIVNSWAGWVAERYHLAAHGREPLPFEGTSDWDAVRRAQWMCRWPDWAVPRVSMRCRTELFVREMWPSVVCVATMLLALRRLSGAELAVLISSPAIETVSEPGQRTERIDRWRAPSQTAPMETGEATRVYRLEDMYRTRRFAARACKANPAEAVPEVQERGVGQAALSRAP
jgi:hypothetical protein